MVKAGAVDCSLRWIPSLAVTHPTNATGTGSLLLLPSGDPLAATTAASSPSTNHEVCVDSGKLLAVADCGAPQGERHHLQPTWPTKVPSSTSTLPPHPSPTHLSHTIPPCCTPPSFYTVCLFADVSGFTALSEAMMRKYGSKGAEHLKFHVRAPVVVPCRPTPHSCHCSLLTQCNTNPLHPLHQLHNYFSLMVKTIASMGGDIFKFAGDAMIGTFHTHPPLRKP